MAKIKSYSLSTIYKFEKIVKRNIRVDHRRQQSLIIKPLKQYILQIEIGQPSNWKINGLKWESIPVIELSEKDLMKRGLNREKIVLKTEIKNQRLLGTISFPLMQSSDQIKKRKKTKQTKKQKNKKQQRNKQTNKRPISVKLIKARQTTIINSP